MKVSPGRVKVEHDDAARVAGRVGLPLREVISLAEEAGRRSLRIVPEPVPDLARPRARPPPRPTTTTTTWPENRAAGSRRTTRHDGAMPVPVETCEACRFDGAQYDLLRRARHAPGARRRCGSRRSRASTRRARPTGRSRRCGRPLEYLSHSADVVANMAGCSHATLTIDDLELPDVPAPADPATRSRSAPGWRAFARSTHDASTTRRPPPSRTRPARGSAPSRTGDAGRRRRLDPPARHPRRHPPPLRRRARPPPPRRRRAHPGGTGACSSTCPTAACPRSRSRSPRSATAAWSATGRPPGRTTAGRSRRCASGRATSSTRSAPRATRSSPASAGENITVSGIDWATIRPGTQLLVGDVLAEISAWATPCKKNAQWFADRDFNRIEPRPAPRLEPRLRLGARARHDPPGRPGGGRAVSATARVASAAPATGRGSSGR